MKEKIISTLVIFLIILIFSIILVIAFRKDKIYAGHGSIVKRYEKPVLFWSYVSLYIFIILFFFFVLLGFVFVNFIK